jgi:hypothetical protein
VTNLEIGVGQYWPVAGSMMVAAVQAHSWCVWTKCRAENSCTGRPVTNASLMALVPMPAAWNLLPR